MDIKKGVAQLSTKENILALFEENKGIYFSGEEIAAQLSVSRAAVWKAVNALRSDGYVIDAVPNKGYRLSTNTDILSVQGIEISGSAEPAAYHSGSSGSQLYEYHAPGEGK